MTEVSVKTSGKVSGETSGKMRLTIPELGAQLSAICKNYSKKTACTGLVPAKVAIGSYWNNRRLIDSVKN
jgi:hypothetical protein